MIIYWSVLLHHPQQVLVTCRYINKFFKPNYKRQISAAMTFKRPAFAKKHQTGRADERNIVIIARGTA